MRHRRTMGQYINETMLRFRRLHLGTSILSVTIVVLFLGLSIGVTIIYFLGRGQLERNVQEKAENYLAPIGAAHTQAMLYRGDKNDNNPVLETLNSMMDELSKSQSPMDVWFVMGPKVVSFQRKAGSNEIEPPTDEIDLEAMATLKPIGRYVTDTLYRYTVPIVLGEGVANNPACFTCHGVDMGIQSGEPIGAYSVSYNATNDIREFWISLIEISAYLIVMSIMTVGVISYVVNRLASKPIAEISDLMLRISQLDHNTKIPDSSTANSAEMSNILEALSVFNATSEQKLVSLRDALNEHAIVSIADVKGDIIYINDKFSESSGYSREELMGKNHRILKSNEHSEAFFKDLWATITNGKTWHGEIKNITKDGGFRWLSATIVPFLNEKGKPFQYVAIRTDITKSKAQEQSILAKNARLASSEQKLASSLIAAEAATASKAEFLASMSHEIRTPMAGVLGMTDLLLDTDLSPQQLDWMTSIKISSVNLLRILSEILDQSRLEAGKLDISPIDFNLASFVKDTTELFIPSIATKGVAFELKMAEDLPQSINADSMRIGQILSNLMSNALKFTQIGKITVCVEQEPIDDDSFMLRISVKDSGIGLSEKNQTNLFSSFSQADSSTSRKYGGTGLGLSISKQLAELMGGEIGVESVIGEGSTFWFTTLCHPAKHAVEDTARKTSPDRWQASRVLHILVAEDNMINQQMIGAILGKLNHEITFADNGKIALKCVEDGDYDLVLMDIRMPVMDGLEATMHIRALDTEKSSIVIIALTADISTGYIEQFMGIGMNAVCTKPIDLPDLLKTINNQLGEEIHTSIPNTLSAAPVEKNADTEGDIKPRDDSTFARVLKRLGAMVDQASSLGSEDTEPPSEMAILLGDKFAKLVAGYEENLVEQCDNLKEAVTALVKNPTDRDLKENIKNITHTIKGGGDTFGYNLITTIATKAEALVSENDVLNEEDLYILKNHSDALKLVAYKKMSGNGGKAGRLLLQELAKLGKVDGS